MSPIGMAWLETVGVMGDPLEGRVELTHEEFARRWRKHGIVLERLARDIE